LWQPMMRQLFKNDYKIIILKDNIISKCLLYKEYEERTDHLILGWPVSGKNEYKIRNDKISTHLDHSMQEIRH
jgi:hypothetical protein